MTEQLKTFYNLIETEFTTECHSYNLFSNIGEVSIDERILISYEYISLHNFELGAFDEIISKGKDQIITYFQQRVKEVKNVHLLAKYYHFLLYISKNNIFAKEAMEYYQQALSYYLAMYDQGSHTVSFSKVLDKIISLSTRFKVNEPNLKMQINNYLNGVSLSSKIKTFIMERVRNSNLLKSKELTAYPKLCFDLAKNESDANIRERLLQLTVAFSEKTRNTELQRAAYDLLGDFEYDNILPYDEKNIAIPHLNEMTYCKIVNYYKKAEQKKKQAKAIRELEENKKQQKFIPIKSEVRCKNAKKVSKFMIGHTDSLLMNAPMALMHILCCDSGNLFCPPYNKAQESTKKQMQQSSYHQSFESKVVDINGNISSIPHEVVSEHQFFRTWFDNCTFPFIITLIGRSIQERKLSYSIAKRYLLKTSFGIRLEISRIDKMFSYNWFSIVDIGLKEFFKQFSAFVKGNKSDWRCTIDFLALKFEAILRDIVKIVGVDVTRVNKNGDTELKPLEELIDSSVKTEVFNEDDIFLFRHTFTKAGLNIRNDVAHGLCKPFDYTLQKAILVFLCVLRLNKVLLL